MILDRIRALDPSQPLTRILVYRFWYWVVFALFTLVYRVRFFGVSSVPRAGGLLIVANHQSHLDPPLIGIAVRHRNCAPIAREGLFRVFPLGWWLRSVGCIPIKEDQADASAVRTAIAQLKLGRVVVIFPEGTRSPDGALKEFKRGTWVLLARSGCDVLPAAVEGCFDAFPRGSHMPRLIGPRLAAGFGTPMPFAQLKAMGPDAALDTLARRVDALRLDLRARLRASTAGAFPRPGRGDLAYPAAADLPDSGV